MQIKRKLSILELTWWKFFSHDLNLKLFILKIVFLEIISNFIFFNQ